MLDATIKTQLKAYLERLQTPIELIATLDDSDKAQEVRSLLDDIATLSTKVSVRNDGSDSRKPSFAVTRPGEVPRIAFAGIPMGHEFTSLVLALLQTGGHPPKVEPEVIEQIKAIPGKFHFETFISLSCHNCPDVVQALNLMSVLNPGISHTMIDGALFQDEVNELKIMAVPTVFLNGEPFGQGRMTLEEIIARIDTGAAAREAEKLAAKDTFDVLVVGGGPAGAAAAIYAARKGVRTGVVAERFGGQPTHLNGGSGGRRADAGEARNQCHRGHTPGDVRLHADLDHTRHGVHRFDSRLHALGKLDEGIRNRLRLGLQLSIRLEAVEFSQHRLQLPGQVLKHARLCDQRVELREGVLGVRHRTIEGLHERCRGAHVLGAKGVDQLQDHVAAEGARLAHLVQLGGVLSGRLGEQIPHRYARFGELEDLVALQLALRPGLAEGERVIVGETPLERGLRWLQW